MQAPDQEAASPPLWPEGTVDLRGGAGRERLCYPAGDVLVVSGLPGSGKSTLIRRAVAGERAVRRVDSQDTRERFERLLPHRLPYALARPCVRLVHYAALRRVVRTGASTVVHDSGRVRWVRAWLAREARRRGAALHLLLLDVGAATALAGQEARGRRVAPRVFARHRRAIARLTAAVTGGAQPRGTASVVLLDRPAADALRTISFERGGGPGE
ncbi:AAA family ATPase [Streptomyces gamaensis]|uniref:AAA family ATPase n=1 Tax=Streptomyces gamaensis TaxID=1763542 RepID=A0ABW0Z0L8_9ACTN